MNKIKFTLKAWPVITMITVALCFLTQQIAKFFGVDLPDQLNLDIVRKAAGWNWRFVYVVAQIVIILPLIEEIIFRFLLFRLPCYIKSGPKWARRLRLVTVALVSSILFSAAHYIDQPFPDTAFAALFFFGLAQCWLYRRTDSFFPTVLNHGLFNLLNLILLFLVPEA